VFHAKPQRRKDAQPKSPTQLGDTTWVALRAGVIVFGAKRHSIDANARSLPR
jgi:hypothetical protein